ARLVDERIVVTLEHVQVDFLRDDSDQRFRRFALAVEITPEHDDAAAGLRDERGDDPYRGRFAGTVRPEEREEIAFAHREIDALERLDSVRIALPQVFDDQRVHVVRFSVRTQGSGYSNGSGSE